MSCIAFPRRRHRRRRKLKGLKEMASFQFGPYDTVGIPEKKLSNQSLVNEVLAGENTKGG
jgi:hypothetical protein